MVNLRREIGCDSNWVSDDDSDGGSESERGKEFAIDIMEDGRGSSPLKRSWRCWWGGCNELESL